MDARKKKRITVKLKSPNPLFEKWLTEWRDKAKESESKMQYCFSLALMSLKKYPLPLQTGKDCKILTGFGEKLCKMLDDKLMQYKLENGDLNNANQLDQNVSDVEIDKDVTKVNTTDQSKTNKNKKVKEYVPQYRSGAFAILVTLYEKQLEFNNSQHLTKAEIISAGQHLSDASFTRAEPNSRYNAWSSMKTLIEKKLVTKQGKPSKFSLTEEGIALADKLYILHKVNEFEKEENANVASGSSNFTETHATVHGEKMKVPSFTEPVVNTISRQTSTNSTQSCSNESVILAPNSFKIILLIDTQEKGVKDKSEIDPLFMELKNLNMEYEIRNLKVGDYTWICRDAFSNNELILPYIVERKRMDDLASSIKDKRFYEQKFRLKQCGLQNLIYLIENHGRNEHLGLPLSSLLQAAVNTLVQDGFMVKFTENIKGTAQYLTCLSRLITNLFKDKTLMSCNKEDIQKILLEDDLVPLMHFKEFNKSSLKTKQFKVREMFIKQLLQIKGVSVDKAIAIVEKYPTPKLLKLAYQENSQIQGEKLLSTIQYGNLKKNIGVILSKIVYQFYCNMAF